MATQNLWSQITSGATVYDQSGEKLGKVVEISQEGQYLVVEKGWLFTKDFYIPAGAISQVTEDGIQLNLTKDALDNEQYDSAPVGAVAGNYSADRLAASSASDIGAIDAGATTLATSTTTERTMRAQAAATSETVTDGDIRVPVYEEELVVGKRAQEEGKVHIHKDVIEEQRTLTVPLEQEHVTIERVAFSGEATADAFVERDIDVPVMGEEVVLSKVVRASRRSASARMWSPRRSRSATRSARSGWSSTGPMWTGVPSASRSADVPLQPAARQPRRRAASRTRPRIWPRRPRTSSATPRTG